MAPTFTVTVALALAPWLSTMSYVIRTGPLRFVAGVYLSVPSGLTVTLPCSGFSSRAPVTRRLSAGRSASVSLPSTLIDSTGVLIAVAAVSSTATGASFTGVTSKRSVFGLLSYAPAVSCTLNVKRA